MTFNTLKIPAKIKVGYTMERVKQFVPNLLRCYKCQKYGHHEDACRGIEVRGKCDQKDSDHHMNECEFPNKCANCDGDHPVYTRSFESWRREKEIFSIKYKNDIPYYEARKMVVESNTTTYSQTVQQGKKQHDKYEEFVKTLIQLDPGDWGSFINKMKASLELDKTNTTTTLETPKKQSNPADKGKFAAKIITKTILQTQTIPPKKQKLQRSPIHPPTSKIDNLG